MEIIEGVNYFKDISTEEKHEIFVGIGKCLDKCQTCPISTVVGSTYCTMEEREERCGGCENYSKMRGLANRLPDYDLTKRQRQLLNKSVEDITGSELEELVFSGVPKAIVARAFGITQRNTSNHFGKLAVSKGANIPKGQKLDIDEQQMYQTKSLGEW